MKRFNLFTITSFVATLLAILFFIVFSYWSFYPYKIISFEQVPFPVRNENKVVKQGELLVYEVEYCKYINLEASVTKTFNDGIIYSTMPILGNREVGCSDNNIYTEIPKNLPPAKYTLQIIYQYKINPIRTIVIMERTEEFTVVK